MKILHFIFQLLIRLLIAIPIIGICMLLTGALVIPAFLVLAFVLFYPPVSKLLDKLFS